jgi:hypothetical protein
MTTANVTVRFGTALVLTLSVHAGLGRPADAQPAGAPADSVRSRVPTQRDVSRMLVSRDSTARLEGLRLAQMVRPEYVTRELRIGLVIALDAEGARYQAQLRTNRHAGRGNGAAERPVSVTHDRLLTTVVALKDTMAIPALSMSLGTGMTPIRALVDFGQPAAAMTLRVANAPAEHQQVADAL